MKKLKQQKAKTLIFSIDPGTYDSAYCLWDGTTILEFGKIQNEALLSVLKTFEGFKIEYVIEKIESYGMPAGAEVFATCVWADRFFQRISDFTPNAKVTLVPRREVKLHLCGSSRAKDSNIIQALKDRFEPNLQPRKRPTGILKGLTADSWQAFALAVTYYDTFV